MTDDFTIREQANKSAEKHNVTFHTEEYVNGYYLGYKAGFHECEKEHEWHDLRKNPNDLPDTDRNVWVKRESEIECQIDNYYEDDKGWGIMFREGYCSDDVILWCELPVPPKE